MSNIPILYRGPKPADLSFILNSWLKSYRNSDFANHIPTEIYFKYHQQIAKNLIAKSMVTIICDPSDQDHIYGYLVYELIDNVFIIHYLYVKLAYRKFGLAKNVLTSVYPQFGEQDSFISHIDKEMLSVKSFFNKEARKNEHEIKHSSWFIKNKKKYKLLYNPYLIA